MSIPTTRTRGWRAALLVPLGLSLGACGGHAGPPRIDYGDADCDYCRMTITDPRYAAELVTVKGKVRQFDSIECLASYYRQARSAGDVRGVWVSDFRHPGTLIAARNAVFVRSTTLHSPMGRGLIALSAESDTAGERREFGGAPMTWAEVVASGGVSDAHDAEAFDVAHP